MNKNDKDISKTENAETVVTDAANRTNRTNRTALKKKAFLEAFALNMGNVSEACESSNIARSTFYAWCEADSGFRQAVDDVREGLLDMTEGELLKLIKKGDTTAIIFYLKTKGKKRGYIEKTETDTHVEIDGAKLLDKIQEDFNSGH